MNFDLDKLLKWLIIGGMISLAIFVICGYIALEYYDKNAWLIVLDVIIMILLILLIVFTVMKLEIELKSAVIVLVLFLIWTLLYCYPHLADEPGTLLFKTVENYKSNELTLPLPKDEESLRMWDSIHVAYDCCGTDGPESWTKSGQLVPLSCCHNKSELNHAISEFCLKEKNQMFVFEKGCTQVEFTSRGARRTFYWFVNISWFLVLICLIIIIILALVRG